MGVSLGSHKLIRILAPVTQSANNCQLDGLAEFFLSELEERLEYAVPGCRRTDDRRSTRATPRDALLYDVRLQA
jgi:hypothetical protein